MTVFKQKTTKGETKDYHYRFMSNGKNYQGVCKGCTLKKAALEYEKNIKAKVKELSQQKSVKALIDNFRQDMTGGSDILIADACELSLKKPRHKQLTEKPIKLKRSCWRDFTEYMQSKYPDITKLADVRKCHAEEYIQLLRTSGRFNKQVASKLKKYSKGKPTTYKRTGNLSNRTCNSYHQELSEVCGKMYDDAGMIENPFARIPKLKNETESREAFTEKELKLIGKKADGFVKAIFLIGVTTALRKGDICTLEWKEVNLKTDLITRKTLKTGRIVEIPIMAPLRSFLLEQYDQTNHSKYVLPNHAEMYLNNPSGITWKVKTFLESIGIKTTKKVDGRDRAISIKDVHSLRHTFCYYAGVYGIPFLIVKDIVGHASPLMTELYQKHAENSIKREKLMKMPDFLGMSANTGQPLLEAEPERTQLKELADSADINKIKQAIELLMI